VTATAIRDKHLREPIPRSLSDGKRSTFPGEPRKDFTMNRSIPLLAVVIGCLVAGSVAEPAMAHMGGSFGYGGHMSGFTSSDTMSTSTAQEPSTPSFALPAAPVVRDPDTRLNSGAVFRALDSPIPSIANSPGP
jgi:hypothetical protein